MQNFFEYMELGWLSPGATSVRLTKPMPAEELKQRYPNMRGIEFDFSTQVFKEKKIDIDRYFEEVLSVYALEEVVIRDAHYLTRLPDVLWSEHLRSLSLSIYYNSDVKLNACPPLGFINRLERVRLSGFNEIAPVVFDSLHLTEVSVGGYTGDLSGLDQASNVRKLSVSAIMSSDTPAFQLDTFTALEELELNFSPSIKKLPAFPFLKSLKLSNFGSNEQPFPLSLQDYPLLETCYLNKCHLDVSRATHSKLKTLQIYNDTIGELSKELLVDSLVDLSVSMPSLTAIPSELFSCKSLETLRLHVGQVNHYASGWHQLTSLKEVRVSSSVAVEALPDFGASNLHLEKLEIGAQVITALPDSWANCPQLSDITLSGKGLFFPRSWAKASAFRKLQFINCQDLVYLDKEIALLPHLAELSVSLNRSTPHITKLTRTVHPLLHRHNVPDTQRLVFGHLIYEQFDESVTYSDQFKSEILQATNVTNSALREVVTSQLWRLNPEKKPANGIPALEGKKAFVAGKTRQKKAIYQEKLGALGIELSNKLTPDVDILLIGDACPELPIDFWNQEHWFFNEVEMEALLQERQPGFMQVLPAADLEPLRQLIWSNEPANERVVLEMIKNGGIPEEIIPDLIVVAKTSTDTAVRNEYRKLLKAKLPATLSPILSDSRDFGKILWSHNNLPEYIQMVFTLSKRTCKPPLVLFQRPEGVYHSYRQQAFQECLPLFFEKPHYLNWATYWFTAKELEYLLGVPQIKGEVKRLMFGYLDEELPTALFQHDTLNELHIRAYLKEIPAQIAQLKRLKILHFKSPNLVVIPNEIMSLKSLTDVRCQSNCNVNDAKLPEGFIDKFNNHSWYQSTGRGSFF